jgi:N-acetylneuraminic acid mutarotase
MSLQKKFDKVTFVRMLVVIGLLGLTSLSLAQDTWTPKTEMPTGRLWFSCEVVDGKIYAIGGATRSGAPTLATVEEYDAVSDSWTSKQDMLTARWNMASAVVDGKIYTIGGALSFQIGVSAGVGTLEVYDPANDTWTAKDDAPTAREAASASVVNGMIYVMGGGAPGGVILNLVEAYDPATDTWTEKTSMRYKRHALSTCVVDGKIYAMGGGRGEWDVEEYDPATDNWTTKVPMLVGVGYFGAGVIDGIIYTVGGGSGPGTPKARLFAYDPVTDNVWSEKTAMQTARFGLGAAVVNGKIYAIGGAPAWPPSPLSVVEEYTPETVSVENYSSHNPKSFVLHQNYPNPFNPETGIKYEISKPTRVVLKVMNLLGQNVRTLVDEEKPTGFFEVMWDGKDDHGKRVASGVYLYILETKDPSKGSGQGFVKTRKMLLLQ